MTNIRNLVIIGVVLFLLLFGLIILILRRSVAPPPVPVVLPTPTAYLGVTIVPTGFYPVESPVPIKILSTNPTDKQSNISVNTDITITFTTGVRTSDIEILTDPNIELTMESVPFHSNQLLVKSTKPLSPGVLYIIRVNYTPYPYYPQTFSFTTTGPTQQPRDTAPNPTIVDSAQRSYLADHPDYFLDYRLPYQSPAFTITATYTKIPTPHFYFDVTLKGTDTTQSKSAFMQWLYSLGMNDGHISRLDIRYQ